MISRCRPIVPICLLLCSSTAIAGPRVPGFDRFHRAEPVAQAEGGLLLLGELNCVACHKADDSSSKHLAVKTAPNLDSVGARVRPEYLRTFLLNPHGTKFGTTMPALVTHTPAANEQVDALVHFLASTGVEHMQHTGPNREHVWRGEKLYHQVGCVACHGPRKDGAKPGATAVVFPSFKDKYSIGSLARFLKDPLAIRRAGRMPSLNLTDEQAQEISNYLLHDLEVKPNLEFEYFEGQWQKLPAFETLKAKRQGTAAGFDLSLADRNHEFALRFGGFLHVKQAGRYTFHLGSDDGSKLSIDGKQVVDCDGIHAHEVRTGSAELSSGPHRIEIGYFNDHGEWSLTLDFEGPGLSRRALSEWLMLSPDKPTAIEPAFVVDSSRAAKGRELFATLGCAACHELNHGGQRVVNQLSAKPFEQLVGGKGCLADNPLSPSPAYNLDDVQRKALVAGLAMVQQATGDPPPALMIERTMTRFNCFACHARTGKGGVEREHNDFFETTANEMGDEGRLPPDLDGVGDKLTGTYLDDLFRSGGHARPYMRTRMPRFGAENIHDLAAVFARVDAQPAKPIPAPTEPMHRLKAAGRFMVGEQGFSCIKCHYFDTHKSTGIQAMDLTRMTQRLRPEWFHRYLRDPAAYRKGTRMPGSWPKEGPSQLFGVLGGDSDKQIHAVWEYLSDGAKAAIPSGLIAKPIELVATSEPVIYRNFIEGAGTRAIGVGYPEKVNLAFDANDMRLALIWHGAFIDASRHWNGRGEGFQPPLGDHVLELPEGVPLAELNSPESAWPKGPADDLGYQFLGYRLDGDLRPVFRYRFHGMEVEESYRPTLGGKKEPGLVRALRLRNSGGRQLAFRAAAGRSIEQVDGWFLVDRAWRTKIQSPGAAIDLRSRDGIAELRVGVSLQQGSALVEQEFEW